MRLIKVGVKVDPSLIQDQRDTRDTNLGPTQSRVVEVDITRSTTARRNISTGADQEVIEVIEVIGAIRVTDMKRGEVPLKKTKT